MEVNSGIIKQTESRELNYRNQFSLRAGSDSHLQPLLLLNESDLLVQIQVHQDRIRDGVLKVERGQSWFSGPRVSMWMIHCDQSTSTVCERNQTRKSVKEVNEGVNEKVYEVNEEVTYRWRPRQTHLLPHILLYMLSSSSCSSSFHGCSICRSSTLILHRLLPDLIIKGKTQFFSCF